MAPVHPVNLVALLHLCLSPIIFVEGNAGVNNMPFISPNPVEGPAQQDRIQESTDFQNAFDGKFSRLR
eukprot:755441-Hanusia_phi.AAC.6